MYFDLNLMLFIAPAILLAMLAQLLVSLTYSAATRLPARKSGFAAARQLLDAAGLQSVRIVEIPGRLTDHYDPRNRTLGLSSDNYHGRTLAAVGIAAHEAGHALQHAQGYAPLAIRNLAAPAANFGSGFGWMLLALGVVLSVPPLFYAGAVLFGCVVFFQLVNLPVEFNASARAKRLLVEAGIVDPREMTPVKRVLNAAALTYLAATLQSILILLYYILRFSGRSRE